MPDRSLGHLNYANDTAGLNRDWLLLLIFVAMTATGGSLYACW